MNTQNHIHSPEFAAQNCYNPIKTLRHFVDGSAEIWIRYTYYIRTGHQEFYEEQTVLDARPGSVMIRSFAANQRFYSNLRMVECSADRLTVARSGGQRIIRIRDVIFVDAQLYAKSGNHVLKMKEDKGFIAIRISDAEYRSMAKQLRNVKPQN